MALSLTIYRLEDLIRITETGSIDLERTKQTVHRLAAAAHCHKAHNILVDLRATVEDYTVGDRMELALELARYQSRFTGKIALILPDDLERLASASQFLTCLDVAGYRFRMKVFTGFEHAIDWLSDKADANRATT